jgi:predicted RecB family nuclease
VYIAVDGGLVVSPTDLTNFLACRHLTELDLAMALGELAPPVEDDEASAVLRARGLEHERDYVERLRTAGLSIVEISTRDLLEGERATLAAMRAGVDIVYQATFFDGVWRGHADFLEKRDDRPSALGDWSYDVADTKLARRVKVAALLQMATYADRLTALQGRPPEMLTVITGDGMRRPYRLTDCAAYARKVRREFLAALAIRAASYPEKVRHCVQCRWDSRCATRRRADDHISLVAGMRRDQARALADAGITTLAGLSAAESVDLPAPIGGSVGDRLVQQARVQLVQRTTGVPAYELLPAEPQRGLARLPAPSSGDLFLDLEGDPYVGDGGLEYLFGLCDSGGRFTAYWALTPGEEKPTFERLVDHLMRAWSGDPAMHVYHYAAYETLALRRLSARHNTRVDEVDRLLRGNRLVDLYAIVRQALRAGVDSYSIKKLEAFYDPDARLGADVADATASIVAFERWLGTGNDQELSAIERYNEIDCRSTLRLRDWLEARRADLLSEGVQLARPVDGDGRPPERSILAARTIATLYEEMTGHLPADRRLDDEMQRATRLLADLLDWHRREARPEWWEYFRRLQLSDEHLVDDPAAVGQLGSPRRERTGSAAVVWRMEFPPQDTKLRQGESRYVDPRTERPQGTVVAIDAERGWLELRRGVGQEQPSCRSLVPAGPLDDGVLRDALRRLAGWVREHGVDSAHPDYRAARDLLLRRPPRGAPHGRLVRRGERPAAAVTRLAGDMAGGVLAVQGPPGSGKTVAAAAVVLRLLASGRRVALCAFSHKAIANLLDSVMTAAEHAGLGVRAVQKADGEDRCRSAKVRHVRNGKDVAAAVAAGDVDLVAGTCWLFARADLAGAFDTLIVDEAGQLALANVLAVAGSARNLLLFGDPQQLAQPAKGDHPPGAATSALEHMLDGAPTLPPDRGVFLDRTWRMHPAVCQFVSEVGYEQRLGAHESCALQRVDAAGPLGGGGIRWVPVDHVDNRAVSTEEAEVVAALLDSLLRGTWIDARGERRPIRLADVLVVAPYNAHVGRLRARLPPGARIGTVDRFQGQEAAVVLYSMATSSAEDAPRGIEFLYSINRLNVAVSRARALAVVVASRRLLDAAVRTPDQLRMVNALCRFAETAEHVAAPVGPVAPSALAEPADSMDSHTG